LRWANNHSTQQTKKRAPCADLTSFSDSFLSKNQADQAQGALFIESPAANDSALKL
jgi:hypothetical protein